MADEALVVHSVAFYDGTLIAVQQPDWTSSPTSRGCATIWG